MKKILTLFVALFATMSFVNAQTILMESFDTGTLPTGWSIVDADADGNNWDPQFGITAGFDTHSGTGLITSASYINNVGPLTPDNWLITPQINLSAAADLTFWAWGQDENFCAEKLGVYVSTTGTNVTDFTSVLQVTTTHAMTEYTVNLSAYVGQNIYIAFRHYDITDMYYLNLDDVEIFAQPTTPTIVANPTALTFTTTPIGDVTASKTITVTGYVLTDAIVATATAPFEVSADNTTFGATATIAATGAPLYVRYAPATAGTENGTITLTSTSAPNVTVSLTGSGVDCSGAISTFPFVEDFELGVPPLCWTIDGSSDTTWTSYAATTNMASILRNDSYVQDEKLITKTFDFSSLNNTILMDFMFMTSSYYLALDNGTDSIFNVTVVASTDGGLTWGAPLWSVQNEPTFDNWAEVVATVDLSSLAGESDVKLAFHYQAQDIGAQFLMDDIEIYVYDDPTILTSVETLSFYAEVNQNEDKTVAIQVYNINDPIVATTAAPFTVSADGTTFGTTATLGTSSTTFYVRYTGVAGNQTGTVTLSTTGVQDVTIALNAVGYDCSNIAFPLVEDFNSGIVPPGCWTVVYGDNNPEINTVLPAATNQEATEFAFAFNSYDETSDYTQYLITPEIEFTGAMALQFEVASYNTLFGPSSETFMIGTSSTTNDVNAFTWSEEMTCSSPSFANIYREIPAGTKYIAIKYTSNYQYYLFVDNFTLDEATGIEEITADNVNVYPNPTKDIVNVNAPAQINNIEVYNIAGQKLSVYNVNNMTAQIDVTELANGIYFLKINTENGMVTKKFNVVK